MFCLFLFFFAPVLFFDTNTHILSFKIVRTANQNGHDVNEACRLLPMFCQRHLSPSLNVLKLENVGFKLRRIKVEARLSSEVLQQLNALCFRLLKCLSEFNTCTAYIYICNNASPVDLLANRRCCTINTATPPPHYLITAAVARQPLVTW